jgi:hypothetical protein
MAEVDDSGLHHTPFFGAAVLSLLAVVEHSWSGVMADKSPSLLFTSSFSLPAVTPTPLTLEQQRTTAVESSEHHYSEPQLSLGPQNCVACARNAEYNKRRSEGVPGSRPSIGKDGNEKDDNGPHPKF